MRSHTDGLDHKTRVRDVTNIGRDFLINIEWTLVTRLINTTTV